MHNQGMHALSAACLVITAMVSQSFRFQSLALTMLLNNLQPVQMLHQDLTPTQQRPQEGTNASSVVTLDTTLMPVLAAEAGVGQVN